MMVKYESKVLEAEMNQSSRTPMKREDSEYITQELQNDENDEEVDQDGNGGQSARSNGKSASVIANLLLKKVEKIEGVEEEVDDQVKYLYRAVGSSKRQIF